MQDIPYFMTDERWFYFDGKKYVLTDLAPKEAEKSLKEYYTESDTNERSEVHK